MGESRSNDICRLSLNEMIAATRAGDLTPTELVDAHLERITEVNAGLNAAVSVRAGAARAEAARLEDERRAGRTPGPLYGIPILIKDAYRVAGSPSTFGLPMMSWYRPFSDCKLVRRLRDAGAIILGRTNVPFASFDWQTDSPSFGLTRNPYDQSRTVGGSSGGAAAAVAAGLTPFDVGSDIAGSIRYPAHCCGVFGLRTTQGLLEIDDIGPTFSSGHLTNLIVAGPIARSIEDLEISMAVLRPGFKTSAAPTRLRVTASIEVPGLPLDAGTRDTIETLLSKIRTSGHDVTRVAFPFDLERAFATWGLIVGYEYRTLLPLALRSGPGLRAFNKAFNRDRFREGPLTETFERGLFATSDDYSRALKTAAEIREAYDDFISEFDIWITPSSPTPAILHRTCGEPFVVEGQELSYSRFFGQLYCPTTIPGHPILNAPLPTAEGFLLLSVQLHGRRGRDSELLASAKAIKALFAFRWP